MQLVLSHPWEKLEPHGDMGMRSCDKAICLSQGIYFMFFRLFNLASSVGYKASSMMTIIVKYNWKKCEKKRL